jgi:predicted Zn-dependent peptidase
MKTLQSLILLLVFILFSRCAGEKYKVKESIDENGYSYETITNDPLKTRIYTLENGLKVYLSVNKDEPRIQTLTGVHAGSTYDPVETTGLAHYFEHMMFKGTDEIASLDWEKEKILLQEISDMFEKRRETEDPKMKEVLYYKIDSLSYEAAKYVATNEYDKMASSIGAKGTNAGTSYDFTVYINNIPSNELEKWARLESERFADMVLRIFHTELETVYEEFNMYQDSDNSRANKMLMKNLFPNHPYGRDVIGLPEHIKNPSMVNIYEFAETFYVPNNIAIALSGDLDYEKTIKVLDKYFGKLEPGELPEINQPKEEPVIGPVVCEITGPSAANLMFAYRFDADNSEDYRYVTLIDMILSNRQAGLIDLNLVQQQKVINAGCSPNFMRDHSIHRFYGIPRQGQTLEEVKNLLLDEVEKIKNGEFEEWMIEAVINDMKLSGIRRNENNFSRSWGYIDAFIKDIPYVDRVKFLDELESISKEELMNFAKTHYNDNYVVVYKRTGANDELVKVEKPEITPIPINRDKQSEFYKEFIKDQPEPIKPVFVDFEKAIVQNHLDNGIKIEYIENKTNELFTLQYILEMGKNHDLKLPLAVNYLPFLGTEKYTPAELQQEFFKLGISMGVYAGNDRSYVYITGLQKSLDPGLELLEHVIANVEPDKNAYDEYVKGILKKRKDRKLSKSSILWGGLFNYGMYGEKSPYTHLISEDNLKAQDPEELTGLLKDLYSYKHKVFYYGSMPLTKIMQVIEKHHKVPEEPKTYPDPVKFVELETNENKVYFVDYDMVQVNIIMMSKDEKLNMSLLPEATLFNEYFGGGLSSIVFQEIRESRALAYSVFAAFNIPAKQERSHFTYGFVGTQADKLQMAIHALLDLMNDMPKAGKQFNLAKESIMKKIESERITKTNIYSTYIRNLDRGVNYDTRKDVYEAMKTMTLDELDKFFMEHIAGKNYTFLVLGDRDAVDMNMLKELGTIREIKLEEIFGH